MKFCGLLLLTLAASEDFCFVCLWSSYIFGGWMAYLLRSWVGGVVALTRRWILTAPACANQIGS